VVVAIHDQDIWPGLEGLHRLEDRPDPPRQGLTGRGQVDPLAVSTGQVGGEHRGSIGCDPLERHAVNGAGHPAHDHGMAHPELPVDLGHLRRVTE
jgi:hypothetical protein